MLPNKTQEVKIDVNNKRAYVKPQSWVHNLGVCLKCEQQLCMHFGLQHGI